MTAINERSSARANQVRWWLFRALEGVAALRHRPTPSDIPPGPAEPALWIFASTIGELSAVEPLLRRVLGQTPDLRIVLITDHDHYREAFLRVFDEAVVHVTDGSSSMAAELGRRFPPRMLLLAEIPARLSDAPCRFTFAYVREASKRGAGIALLNGWLYHQQAACRMDAIEQRLLDVDYLSAFDALCVQTERVREELIRAGAPAARVTVAGNVKFDAMNLSKPDPSRARSALMIGDLIARGRATVVAGSVTMTPEQTAVLDAFSALRDSTPDLPLLVLAPRHPEKRDLMDDLRRRIEAMRMSAEFRSRTEDQPLRADLDVLVLDTIGELRDFYAAATVAHVGRNHNVLEPLAFGRPISVLDGWNPVYPSYPVFDRLREGGALGICDDGAALAETWLRWIRDPGAAKTQIVNASTALVSARGAVDRHMTALAPLLLRP